MTTNLDTRRAVAVRAARLTKVYGHGDAAVVALDALDLDLAAGELTAVMGPSGSGKSTLLHCLAALDTPTSGEVFLGDQPLSAMSDRALTILRRTRIGFVFQAYNLVPAFDALENITLPLALGGRRADGDWLDTVVDAVGLRDRLTHRPAELSGGQQQRVAVARALVTRPEVVFADEPTGNLDSQSGSEILGFLRRAVDTLGQTVVMVTHDPVAAAHADRVVFLVDGRVVDDVASPTADLVLERMKGLGK
jgi:putative ABC transport system ATP-binding protein